MIPSPVQRFHDLINPWLLRIEERVEGALRPYCKREGFLFDGRVKSATSLSEKLETGRYARYEDLDDLYACSVVVPSFAAEPTVLKHLRSTFTQRRVQQRRTGPRPPDAFRFDATRFYATVALPDGDPAHATPIGWIRFEVQIQTYFEFAWARSTHDLAYKSDDLSWGGMRLVSQLKAVVEQIDQQIQGFEAAASFVGEGEYPYLDDQRAIIEGLQRWMKDGLIPIELQPNDRSRFASNLYCAIQAFAGSEPQWRSSRSIPLVPAAIKVLDSYFRKTPQDLLPRSLSLYQTCTVQLAATYQPEKSAERFHFPVSNDLRTLFDRISFPGPELDLEALPNENVA